MSRFYRPGKGGEGWVPHCVLAYHWNEAVFWLHLLYQWHNWGHGRYKYVTSAGEIGVMCTELCKTPKCSETIVALTLSMYNSLYKISLLSGQCGICKSYFCNWTGYRYIVQVMQHSEILRSCSSAGYVTIQCSTQLVDLSYNAMICNGGVQHSAALVRVWDCHRSRADTRLCHSGRAKDGSSWNCAQL